MRRHPLHTCTWPALLGVVLALAACSSTTENGGFTVTYRLGVDSTGIATFDSLKYDDGTGVLLKVNAPAANYAVSVTVSPGASVEAHAWAKGVRAGHSTKFVVVWMTAMGALAGDSTSHAVADTTRFVMDLSKRTL
jgi:hypothetical protein